MNCSALFLDIRNFTNTFKIFNEIGKNSFLGFIEDVYKIGLEIANLVIDKKKEYYISSTGDGFLLLTFGLNNHIDIYLYGLLLYHKMKQHCDSFNKTHTTTVSFGIGIDTGDVDEIKVENGSHTIKTYLGNVINIAARLEAETKSHARAKLIIGTRLNNELVNDLFKEDYQGIMDKVKDQNNDQIQILISKMNDLIKSYCYPIFLNTI